MPVRVLAHGHAVERRKEMFHDITYEESKVDLVLWIIIFLTSSSITKGNSVNSKNVDSADNQK